MGLTLALFLLVLPVVAAVVDARRARVGKHMPQL